MSPNPYSNFNFKLVSRCPMCSAPAQRAHIDMVGETGEGNMLLYSRCGSCGIGLIAALAGVQQGMFGAAILTDLKKNEIAAFADSDALSADDVMEFTKQLNKKNNL